MKSPSIEVKPELVDLIKELCNSNREISLLSLSTTDGFNIKSFAAKSLGVEADKLAAMSSSLFALSNSSSLQLMKAESTIATIESGGGNMLFMNARYLDRPCVVTMVARPDLSLAQARFSIKRFANAINEIN